MRLIDADALLESILTAEMGKVYKFCFPCKEMQQAIDEQPIIEAVEVVRCCNCKWSKEHSGRLFCTNGYNARAIYPYGFCEKGKR